MTEKTRLPEQAGAPEAKIEIEKKAITLEAIKLARSNEKAKHEQLRTLLTDKDYLDRLNTPDQYLHQSPIYLQLYFIFEALSENSDKLALGTLDTLAGSPLYQEPGPRQVLLLLTSGKITTAPTNIQQLWKDQLKPDADELELTVEMLIANGSPKAIGIFEDALLRHKYEQDYVIAWLQGPVLTHRQDIYLLEASERLLKAENWPGKLRSVLVEVLFDYRPEYWYAMIENEPPKPPGRDTLSVTARRKLIDIADLALRQGYFELKRYSEIKAELTAK